MQKHVAICMLCMCVALKEMLAKEKSVKGEQHSVEEKYWHSQKKNKALGVPLSLTSLYQQREAQRLTDLAEKAGCSPIDS